VDNHIKKELLLKYEFPKFTRYFTLFMGISLIIYSVFIISTQINSDSSTLKKFLPMIIIFFAFDSVYRNLFSLNKILISNETIKFSFLAKKSTIIKWENMVKIETFVGKKKYFLIHYKSFLTSKCNDETTSFQLPMAFKDIIYIINWITKFAPHVETDEFVSSLLFNDE